MSKINPNEFDPESAIIDAELLVKYRMVNRAIETVERYGNEVIAAFP